MLKRKMPSAQFKVSSTDGAGVKNPTYKGKKKAVRSFNPSTPPKKLNAANSNFASTNTGRAPSFSGVKAPGPDRNPIEPGWQPTGPRTKGDEGNEKKPKPYKSPMVRGKGAKGFGRGGRFGKGGWQRKSRAAAYSWSDRQNEEAERKKIEMAAKRKSAMTRKLKSGYSGQFKQGPNRKQTELLGGE